jgi:hypothetical protein
LGLEDARLVRTDGISKRVGYSALKPRVIFDGDEMRVIFA